MKSVLFVCLGNICRSPAAEGVFRHLCVAENEAVTIESAGTGGWHVGGPPDPRMVAAAKRRGVYLSNQRARQVDLADFYEFDYIVAMDLANHSDLLSLAPPNRSADLRLFMDFGSGSTTEVPDPYYGGEGGFDLVLDLVEDAAKGLLDHIKSEN